MKEVTEKDEWCIEAYLETDYNNFTFEDYEMTVKKHLMFYLMNLSGTGGGENEIEDEDLFS